MSSVLRKEERKSCLFVVCEISILLPRSVPVACENLHDKRHSYLEGSWILVLIPRGGGERHRAEHKLHSKASCNAGLV